MFTLAAGSQGAASQQLGIFENHQDVGTVLHPGSAAFDAAKGAYTIAGSGENMWFGVDDFHFAWKKVSGDVALTADIAFVGTGGNPHRKAVLMIRQTLDGNSQSVDVAVHGSGLTSLQFRNPAGDNTHEVEANISAPKTVRIEKRGDYIYAFVTGKDGKLQPAGASTKLALTGPFYIGIGVCAHDKDVVEKAVFSNVSFEQLAPASGKQVLVSTLETIKIASTDRHVEYVAAAHFEAPNWSRDGAFLVFNQDGTLHRLAFDGSAPTLIPTAPQILRTARSWPSATSQPRIGSLASTSYRSPAARQGRLRRMRLRIGTDGRPTARPWPLPENGTATSISTACRWTAEKKLA